MSSTTDEKLDFSEIADEEWEVAVERLMIEWEGIADDELTPEQEEQLCELLGAVMAKLQEAFENLGDGLDEVAKTILELKSRTEELEERISGLDSK